MARYDALHEILRTAGKADVDLDRQVWSLLKGHSDDGQVPHYADCWFSAARHEGDPEARATTDISAALSVLNDYMPGAGWKLERSEGAVQVCIDHFHEGYLIGDRMKDAAQIAPQEIALAIMRNVAACIVTMLRIDREIASAQENEP
ncbi:hypothetical protein ACEUZ9_000872 [Paracoccus litorisediminis]|uniref:hypothetical protein n=1 Tax=Paracoccus litorisediminis TaxID=2006130 RepID=UPI00372E0583